MSDPPNINPDPRMGDEEDLPCPSRTEIRSQRPATNGHRKEVKLHLPSLSLSTSDSTSSKKAKQKSADKPPNPWLHNPIADHLLLDFAWVPANWTWAKLKPVIRSSVLSFVSVVLLVIPRAERALGNASFLILIGAFLDPPTGSFIEVVERELILVTFLCLGWAWNSLGIFLASLARSHIDHNPPMELVITGEFLEAGPTVILGVFIFIGCFFFLYLKARLGPGPFVVATVFGAICVDIPMLTAALFPFPNYNTGKAIVVPLSIHAGLSILCSALLFPTTITAQYTGTFNAILAPISQMLVLYRNVLKMDPASDEFAATASAIHELVDKSETGLFGAGATSRLLKRDILWGRFSPNDIGALESTLRPMVVRTNGMALYFAIIDPTRERFPMTPAPSAPPTPTGSHTPTRSSTPVDDAVDGEGDTLKRRRRPADHGPSPLRQSLIGGLSERFPTQSTVESDESRQKEKNDRERDWSRAWARHFHHHKRSPSHHAAQHDNHLHFSLLQLAHSLSTKNGHSSLHLPQNTVVGVFESQRYVTLEATRLGQGTSAETTALFVSLLQESCDPLLQQCQGSLKAIQDWIANVRNGWFADKTKAAHARKTRLETLERVHAALNIATEEFRTTRRLRVLDPYRSAFDPNRVGSPDREEPPPHKFLFHCYVYEYHFLRFSIFLGAMLDRIITLEKERPKARLWLPTIPLRHFVESSSLQEDVATNQSDDENPDILQGLDEHAVEGDLGAPLPRDPDALPPSNNFQLVMTWVYRGYTELFSGNSLFAMKAAVLSILLSIPSLLKSSAAFAYGERFVWAVFMAQLTIARWRGDTTFGLVSRILATFFGCLVGMALWYISTGSGRGNAYGLAVVTGVASPFLYYGRLYWTGPPMTNIIFFVTIMLIIGYSWQNTHFPIGFNYWGWPLAWRRFILVAAGVTAAFIFSFLPPSTTLRSYQRRMMSTTVSEFGSVYCSIVSFANTNNHTEAARMPILQKLLAIRLKLKRSHVMKANIVYEFSLRGRWPAERYKKILDTQVKLAYLLSHLLSVIEMLEPAWTRAFLKRTRLIDSDFQGDILAVISLISTSLRTGQPLPQITPCPLVDRFMAYTHGLNVIRQEGDDDYGLPRTMTIDTLENEQYMYFSVGVTTAFGIVMRLDRLMVATKELVGEQYHIHGIGLDYRPPRDV